MRSKSTVHPSGHCDGLSGDVGRLLGAQERNHTSDFLRFSNSERRGKFNASNPGLNITNKLSCDLELHLLMHSCFFNSSTTPSFCHSWNKRRVYYKKCNTNKRKHDWTATKTHFKAQDSSACPHRRAEAGLDYSRGHTVHSYVALSQLRGQSPG